jgi:hypothetical protein
VQAISPATNVNLNAEKIQLVKCFMFTRCGICCASNFRTPARRAGFENFWPSVSGQPADDGWKGRRTKPSADSAGQNDRAPHNNRVGLAHESETVTVAAIEAGIPTLVEALEIIATFHLMIRRKAEVGLTPWIERARASRPCTHNPAPCALRSEGYRKAAAK